MARLIPVTFTFPHVLAPHARRVAVIGPFNGWDPGTHRLVKTPGGDWRITVFLPPGRVVYGFSIDGEPRVDPFEKRLMLNGWGREYSVRYVRTPRGRRLRPAAVRPKEQSGSTERALRSLEEESDT